MKDLCLSQPKIYLNSILNIKKLISHHKSYGFNVFDNFVKMDFSKMT